MARHTWFKAAGLAVTAMGTAVGAGAGVAQAADADPASALHTLDGGAGYATAPIKYVPINPLARTGVDPLDNGVGTQVSDFRPVETREFTGSLGTARDLPAAGPLLGGLPPR
jgi:hypothetical protein